MELLHYLQDLLVVFSVAGSVVFLFHHLRLPAVVGLLVAGVVMGPYALSLVREVERVQVLAEIGVVVLLFTVGLEFSLSRLLGMWPLMLKIGAPQVLVSGVAGFLATRWYFGATGPAVFVGMLVAMSSTAVVLKVLTDRGELSAPHGRVAVAVLLLQDLLVAVFMMLVPILAGRDDGPSIWLVLGQGVLVMVVVVVAAKYVVPFITSRVIRTRNRELFLTLVVILCLGTAALTASLGMSLALGAFLAGLALSETEFGFQTMAEVLPFRDTLASLFFVSVGMLLNVKFVAEHWLQVMATVLALLALKFVAASVPTWCAGYPPRVALLTGAALAQIGEFSFVLAGLGMRERLLGQDDYQTFLAAAVITIALTPLLIAGSARVAEHVPTLSMPAWLRSLTTVGSGDEEVPRRNHVIIVGYGVNGRNLARVLRDVDIPYVVLELNPDTVRRMRALGEPILYGDCTRPAVLEHVHVGSAHVLVIAISDPVSTRRAVQMARQLNAGLHIIVRTRFVHEVDELRKLGANEIIPEEFETAVEIFARVLREYEVPRNLILDLIERIRGDHYEVLRDFKLPATRIELPLEILSKVETESCLIKHGSPAIGRTVRDLELRKRTGATLIAVRRGDDLLLNPDPDLCFVEGDIAVLIGDRPQVDRAIFQLDPSLAAPQA